jgi:uncharacterized membrane protein
MENEIKNFYIEKNYRNNDALRASFNRLAEKTFGLNFENWYQNAQLYMVGNPGLYMFYLSQFMTENMFYIEECSSYAVAEMEDDTLILHTIIGNGAVDEVIRAFGSQVKKAVLCFTPKDTDGFEKSELHEEDTTFFVQGKFFEENHNEEYMMQAITHA